MWRLKPHVRAFQNVNAFADMQVDYSRPVSQQDVYWAFQDTPQGRDLALQFDLAFSRLYKQKSFCRLFTVDVINPQGCKR
jgi:hypothetical protein